MRKPRSGFDCTFWLPGGGKYRVVTDKVRVFTAAEFLEQWNRTVAPMLAAIQRKAEKESSVASSSTPQKGTK